MQSVLQLLQTTKKNYERRKKTNPPKFNIYWIYGAVIFVLLGLSLFGGNDWQTMQKTNISNFEQFLNAGDVSEVIVITKQEQCPCYPHPRSVE